MKTTSRPRGPTAGPAVSPGFSLYCYLPELDWALRRCAVPWSHQVKELPQEQQLSAPGELVSSYFHQNPTQATPPRSPSGVSPISCVLSTQRPAHTTGGGDPSLLQRPESKTCTCIKVSPGSAESLRHSRCSVSALLTEKVTE